MFNALGQQYEFIRFTRQTLFSFLEEIPGEQLSITMPNFGSGSIIKTHIHVANCYRYWLGSFATGQRRADFSFSTEEEIANADIAQVRKLFTLADEVVLQFIEAFKDHMSDPIENEVKWQSEPWRTTPLWLLTHTETHEFHHKGQIVAMARTLGYTPPDTDLQEYPL